MFDYPDGIRRTCLVIWWYLLPEWIKETYGNWEASRCKNVIYNHIYGMKGSISLHLARDAGLPSWQLGNLESQSCFRHWNLPIFHWQKWCVFPKSLVAPFSFGLSMVCPIYLMNSCVPIYLLSVLCKPICRHACITDHSYPYKFCEFLVLPLLCSRLPNCSRLHSPLAS